MATIKDYGNGKFRIVASNGRRHDGKPNRASWTIEAKSMKEAEKKAVELEYEFKHGKKKSISKKYSFNDLINEWRKSDRYQQMSPKTIERYEGMLKHKLIPAFGVWPLVDIRPLDIMHFIASLRKPGARLDINNQNPYSDKTIQGYYIILHSLFDDAVRWEMMSENVCDKVDKPSIKKHKAKFYEEEQIDRLLECLDLEGKTLEISLKKRNLIIEGNQNKKKES
ncbi:tyrosine-type recombinase/integrase [Ruminiclostridium josui]|uniref:tyrosine-type recombinase/integrase n=1 Tax=Ruminiclostridium josui TaxID=1499 RepID=UPI0006D03D63|nr:site-specific integrase [Ruminiclostridium josui]